MNDSSEERAAGLLSAAPVGPEWVRRLARYMALVVATNQHFNLTGAKSLEAFLPHVLDSLTVREFALEPLIDIGSGAGLPGIPIAISTGFSVTFCDSSVKKAAFLTEACDKLELKSLVLANRAEMLGRQHDLREHFGSATARALSTAPTVLELTAPFLRIGGLAILQRGSLPWEEKRALEEAAMVLSCRVEREVALDSNRRLVLVRKIGPTPERFPRRSGIPEKRPLGMGRNVPRETTDHCV